MVVFPLPGQQQLCRFHFCLILVYTVDLKHIASSSSVCFTLLCGRQVKDIRTAFQGSQRTFSLLVFWNNLLPISETLGLSFFFSNFPFFFLTFLEKVYFYTLYFLMWSKIMLS